ncbi:MAG: cyclase family protein [bacterium]|nr:cyclase family protein [bacterium]
MKYIDLTRSFGEGVSVYPGDPHPEIKTVNTVEADGFTLSEVRTGMHVGTHMDAPLHFILGGKKMYEIPVEKFFGRGIIIDARGKDNIDIDLLNGVALKPGDIVLVLTGWSARFEDEKYFTDYPDITIAFAEKLISAGVSIVGTDSASPDHEPFETHKKLLGNDILIIENLVNLEELTAVGEFNVVALPVKYETEATPVRVVSCIL